MEGTLSTRKRLRSDSLPSDASSPKRHTSGSPHPHPLDANDEIDAYMADQPDDAESLPASSPQSSDKVDSIDRLRHKTMEVGQTWYLVDRTWFRRWQKACKGEVDKEGPVSEQDLGPVAVEPLLDQYGNLKPGLTEGVDVEYVPEEAWNHFITWYGKPVKSIARKAISRGQRQQVQLELHPPRFRVLRLTDGPAQKTDSTCHPSVTLSSRDTLQTLCHTLAKSVSSNSENMSPYRVWVPDNNGTDFDFNYKEYPHTKIDPSLHSIVKPSDMAIDDTPYQSDDPFVVEFAGDNGWIVDVNNNNEPAAHTPIFNSSEGFFNKMTPKPMARPSNALTTFGSQSTISSSSTSGKTLNGNNGKAIEPGTLGLGNMGNTCFMNSALQCLAHTKELTEYFQSGVYRDELNPDNPLGMHGAIAEAFGALLERIWASTGVSTSYSPREFKSQLQRFAPQFSGYQQHDSQELVAFLLDGLHEDLNRVLKKPYVEKPDWEGGGDKELLKLAKESWDGYKLRNDSVIVDLFQGQYQSTLVCPECQKVSITFDPFMYLTLPLPIQKKWRHTIFYVPWNLSKPHVKVPIEINRDSTFKDVRALLARWMSSSPSDTEPSPEPINPDNLLTLEIFGNRFYKNLDDTVLVSDMSANDVIVCFELPCHAQQARSYKDRDKEKKKCDSFVLPLFLCDAMSERPARMGGGYGSFNYRSGSASLFGYPSIVVVSQEQAKSKEGTYEAVVDRLQRWTRNARDLWTWEEKDDSERSALSSEEDIVKIDLRSGDVGSNTSVIEVRENGDVVEMQPEDGDEGDIVDEKFTLIDGALEEDRFSNPRDPVRVGVKKNIFTLKFHKNYPGYGTNQGYGPASSKYESCERRQQTMDEGEQDNFILPDDALFCEWDENMKAYYFGEEKVFEHARWDEWEDFIHPEYLEAQRRTGEKKTKGISLQDCLDEFTKEEKLGEDDLWYCPRCKKHQQATKRFDLWNVPDVLVVHLKRFSNSRMLRDKIDAFVDFPIDGLDLTDMVGEWPVVRRLKESGLSAEELGEVLDVVDAGLDEPLIYDLFAVDEHIGGLGGGHYRAYALNHTNNQWYHFDDSYVTAAKSTEAVNANAYLLFYRRRTSKPLGGRSHELTEEARLKPNSDRTLAGDTPSLPTPSLEPAYAALPDYFSGPSVSDLWTSGTDTRAPLPSPSLDIDPPPFEDSHNDSLIDGNDITIGEQDMMQRYRFMQRPPAADEAASPVSSTGAEPDVDSDVGDSQNFSSPAAWSDSVNNNSVIGSPSTSSPSGSPKSDLKDVPMGDVDVGLGGKQHDGLGLRL